jgi:outer membrane protein TolC
MRSLLVSLAALLALPAAALELGAEVQPLLDHARRYHPEMRAMQHEADAATERVEAAGAWPDPMVKIELQNVANQPGGDGLNLLPSRVGSTRYSVSQMIPWFGKSELRQRVAEAGASDAAHVAHAHWRDMARDIRQLHARRYLNHIARAFAADTLEQLQQLEQTAQTRYAHGLAAQQEAIRAQTERSMLLSEIAGMEAEAAMFEARLRALLGNPPDLRLVAPQRLDLPSDVGRLRHDALEAALLEANPWLASEAARVAGAEQKRELTYRERYPDLTLGVAPMQERNRIGGWDLMLELTVPLQQQRRRSEEREAERMVSAAQARREAAQNMARAELNEAYALWSNARRQDELATTRLLPQAELNVQAAFAAYENGKADFATVLDAQRQWRKAREDSVRWRAEQAIRLADIERLTGVAP